MNIIKKYFSLGSQKNMTKRQEFREKTLNGIANKLRVEKNIQKGIDKEVWEEQNYFNPAPKYAIVKENEKEVFYYKHTKHYWNLPSGIDDICLN